MVDLHAHTYHSDGTLSPTELVELALEKNLTALAVTDHDTSGGVAEAVDRAFDTSLEIIPGVELSTEYKGIDLHIVGLFVNHNDKEFIRLNDAIVRDRTERAIRMCERLTEYGMPVDYKELVSFSTPEGGRPPILTRGHFGRFLLHKGYVASIKEAFDKYIGEDGPCYEPWDRITPKEGIRRIRNANGFPIFAHPLKYGFSDEELRSLIVRLKSYGLKGIEVYYSSHTEEETAYVKRLAEEYDLLPSGASDFHGSNKPDIELGTGRGNLCIDESILLNIKHKHFNVDENTKAFFSDYDGTLSTSWKTISEKTHRAIKQWTENGNIFVLSSGRPLSDIFRIRREQLPFKNLYLIGSDGAEIYDCDNETLLSYEGMPKDVCADVIAMAKEEGIYVHAYSQEGIIAREETIENIEYRKWVPLPIDFIGEQFDRELPVKPPKILAIVPEGQERMMSFREKIMKKYAGQLICVFSSNHYMEIISARVDKGKGMLWLSRRLGIDRENTFAAGDAENDSFMIEQAGTGIVMKNGLTRFPALSDIADVITSEDNDHDGLAEILLKNC